MEIVDPDCCFDIGGKRNSVENTKACLCLMQTEIGCHLQCVSRILATSFVANGSARGLVGGCGCKHRSSEPRIN